MRPPTAISILAGVLSCCAAEAVAEERLFFSSPPQVWAGEEFRVIPMIDGPYQFSTPRDYWFAVEFAGQFYFYPNFGTTPDSPWRGVREVPLYFRFDWWASQLGEAEGYSVRFTVPEGFTEPFLLTWYLAETGDLGFPPTVASSTTRFVPKSNFERYEAETMPRFSLSEGKTDFYALPFPSDLRLTASGKLDLSSFPNPYNLPIMQQFLAMSTEERTGFHLNPVCQFAFNNHLDLSNLPVEADGHSLPLNNPFISFGRLPMGDGDLMQDAIFVPVKARYWSKPDGYQPGKTLAVAPDFGNTLDQGGTYACIIWKGLKDSEGREVGSPAEFQRLLAGVYSGTEERRASQRLEPLRRYLDTKGISPDQVLMAAVFTTDGPADRFQTIYRAAMDEHFLDINTPLSLTQTFDDYYVLKGAFDMPQFVSGWQPFDTEGKLITNSRNVPVRQSVQKVPVVVTIPRKPMPAEGFPLTFYVHGSGGTADSLVTRGKRPDNVPGEGPARYLAAAGSASVSIAMPVNPERLPGAWTFQYMNFNNIQATKGIFRQGTIELGLVRKWMDGLQLPAELAPEAAAGTDTVHFNPDKYLCMGQSMGAMYTTFFSALEPSIRAAIPTGAGGFWSMMLMHIKVFPGKEVMNLLFGIGNEDIDEFHPIVNLGQLSLEHVDPVVYAPHLYRRPLWQNSPKHVFYPAGYIDDYFPPPVISAYCIAAGLPVFTGPNVRLEYPQMVNDLSRIWGSNLAVQRYPAWRNRGSGAGYYLYGIGTPVTVGVAQYPQDTVSHGHYVSFQLEEPKYQYRCFVQSFIEDEFPYIPAPRPVSAECSMN